MDHYTIDNLPDSVEGQVDDLRLSPAKNRMTFLWSAFRFNVLRDASIIAKIALIIVLIGIIATLASDRLWKAFVLLAALVAAYGKFLWASGKAYSSLRKGDCFPVLTSKGPQQIMDIDNGEQYIRVESAPWREVKCISFYSRFLAIEMKDESESGFFYMWSDDIDKAKRTALAMWRNALKAEESGAVQPELYSSSEMEEVSDFIENNFGSYQFVLHEVVSPDIHVDIIIVPPTEDRNYYTLCTMGVGAHRMNVPDQYRYGNLVAERAELLIYLPPDWDLSKEHLQDERNYWPIRLLKDFARMPIETDCWIGWGHSMSHHDDETFAEGVPYSSSVLLCPQPEIDNPVSLPLSTGKSIDFFQVFPLTQEELDYKLQCADDEKCDLSPTDAMLDHFSMDRDHWIEYLMKRYSYTYDDERNR